MNNKDILLDAIGDVDETLIPGLTPQRKQKRIRKSAVLGGICAAAVIACVLLIPKTRTASPYDALPQTDHTHSFQGTEKIPADVLYGDMGFEGLMAYDISELDTPNPWNADLNLSALPVYRNLAYTEERIPVYLSKQQMQEIADNTAALLNAVIKDMEITYVKDFVQCKSEELLNSVYSIEAVCSNDTRITVYGNGQIQITFDQYKLPSDYHFSYSNTTKEEAMDLMQYLTGKFDRLLDSDDTVCYSVADRTYEGNEIRSYFAYAQSDDIILNILNYNLGYTSFAPDDNGNLMCIRLNHPLCAAEYLGDYPILTVQEGTALLLDGNYHSSVPADYLRNGKIAKEDIAKTELVYRNGRDAYFLPYYKYYISLDTSAFQMADDLKNYGIFYVPAIKPEYLEDKAENIALFQ